ncbi:MAG: hypothetical protein CSYNP_02578 [Syntrophus sp. SKADARSKE-3]|nr:hypothetical protein [Syntrophus sp. SKADARSKE-3]
MANPTPRPLRIAQINSWQHPGTRDAEIHFERMEPHQQIVHFNRERATSRVCFAISTSYLMLYETIPKIMDGHKHSLPDQP